MAAGTEGRLGLGGASSSQWRLDHLWSFLWPLRGWVSGGNQPPNTSHPCSHGQGTWPDQAGLGWLEAGVNRLAGGELELCVAPWMESEWSGIFWCLRTTEKYTICPDQLWQLVFCSETLMYWLVLHSLTRSWTFSWSNNCEHNCTKNFITSIIANFKTWKQRMMEKNSKRRMNVSKMT